MGVLSSAAEGAWRFLTVPLKMHEGFFAVPLKMNRGLYLAVPLKMQGGIWQYR